MSFTAVSQESTQQLWCVVFKFKGAVYMTKAEIDGNTQKK